MSTHARIYLCPGQGAQSVGMGRSWRDGSRAAAQTFARADALLAALPSTAQGAAGASSSSRASDSPWSAGRALSDLCFDGPKEQLDRTDISQPALFVCGVACARALSEHGAHGEHAAHGEHGATHTLRATAGLSLGEYTALVIAGALDFEDGLRLVAERGRLMQQAAEASKGGMVALIGAEESQADQICADAAQGEVLVCANFNAPGQIVISGHATACDRAEKVAAGLGVRFSRLAVAGAFHSPLMAPAAEGLARALEPIELRPPQCDVWSNVTARCHDRVNLDLIKKLLVEQLVAPVRWSQSCQDLIATVTTNGGASFHEVAPGTVLKGLMRRINRSVEVANHDQFSQHNPHDQSKPTQSATA